MRLAPTLPSSDRISCAPARGAASRPCAAARRWNCCWRVMSPERHAEISHQLGLDRRARGFALLQLGSQLVDLFGGQHGGAPQDGEEGALKWTFLSTLFDDSG